MFSNDKLIYLQLQKTGCSHIAYLLSKYIGGYGQNDELFKHTWLQYYGGSRFILGSIRNPWDWYVSLWAYGCKKKGAIYFCTVYRFVMFLFIFVTKFQNIIGLKGPGRNYNEIFTHFKNEFNKPIKEWAAVYKNIKDPECFRRWLKLIFNQDRKLDIRGGYSECSISNFAGLLTFRYCRMYQKHFFRKKNYKGIKNVKELKEFDKENNIIDIIIKNENLEEDLIDAIKKIGYNLDDKTIKSIKNERKTNVSKHLDSSFYYDEETINLVAEKEKFIIDKYGYKPPKFVK